MMSARTAVSPGWGGSAPLGRLSTSWASWLVTPIRGDVPFSKVMSVWLGSGFTLAEPTYHGGRTQREGGGLPTPSRRGGAGGAGASPGAATTAGERPARATPRPNAL